MPVDPHIAEQFVRDNWSALAASAWRFQIHYGPGALIVEWAVVERWLKNQTFPFQPRYTTETDNRDFNAVIAGYDPRTAIVIAFADDVAEERRRKPRLSRSSRRKPAPPPPAALAPPVVLRPGIALAAMTVTAVPSPPEAHRARGH
jgi:hypothetical protein